MPSASTFGLRREGLHQLTIDDFEVLSDPGELEIDKSCALPLNEFVLKYPSDTTGTNVTPLNQQRVLIATLNGP